ncbi:MAG: ABC transporter substrate-binding protein [Clostridia bacterium]|nr:ABC transporter substrate-binding protein [Clostridia bacterium]
MKRRLSLCLAAICLLLCVGCADGEPVSSAPPVVSDTPDASANTLQHMALAYSHDDTLNPYTAATEVNLRLAGLLYDSLTVMGADMTPTPSLAATVETPDPTHVVTTLRDGAVFSDGSAVTAEDVAASFRQAKTSRNYKALLANVATATANAKQRQVTFTLSSPDPHAAACLSFPVVKAATLTNEAAAAPIGGGLYTLQAGENGHLLQANPRSGKDVHFQTVSLRHLPNTDSMYYGLAAGDITYYFNDLSGNSIPRVSGAHTAVDMNALFYMGVNGGRAVLSQPTVRQALSLLLDRAALVNASCSGWGEGTVLPLHPRFAPVAALKPPAPTRDLDGALERLTAAGYGNTANAKPLQWELIYHADNTVRAAAAEQIRLQAQGAGIEITLVPLSEKDYRTRLNGGKYDLYLAEIRLTADMNLRPLLAGGASSYGIPKQGAAAVAYGQYLTGEKTLQEFLQIFSEDMSYIPLCWRRGYAAYDRRLTAVTPTAFHAYAGMEAWR